ncbi:MAG: SDR family NAD(P)-dependent oxidoreductase [Raoultibacter sp.]
MSKKIALVTGASGGIGKEFVRSLLAEPLDEIWSIARNQEKLETLKQEFGDRVVVISADLANSQGIEIVAAKLQDESPEILFLINNAGVAKMGSYEEFSLAEIENTIALNCTALAALCNLCLPRMPSGSYILNISSASAFQPLPHLNLYGATKVFERNYSRALNREVKERGIMVTAVCPSWVDTELLMREVNGRLVRFHGLVAPETVVSQALCDAKKGKDMSVCTLYTKWIHVLTKVFPQSWCMNTWQHMMKRYDA